MKNDLTLINHLQEFEKLTSSFSDIIMQDYEDKNQAGVFQPVATVAPKNIWVTEINTAIDEGWNR